MFHDEMHEIDAIMSRPVDSEQLARWERKKIQNFKTPNSGGTTSKTKSCTSTGKSLSSGVKLSGTISSAKKPAVGSKQYAASRYIPDRDGMNRDLSIHKLTSDENFDPSSSESHSTQHEFNHRLAESLFEGASLNSKVLAFKQKAPRPTEGFSNNLRVLYTQNKQQKSVSKVRHISSTPERILDAPDLLDDYYLNLLDWSSQNVLAVALGACVYLWDAATGDIETLCEMKNEDEVITSVQWMPDGSHLALGTSDNVIQLWNLQKQKQVRAMKGHAQRVGSLAWNNCILSSGSRDSMILHHDVRIQHHVVLQHQGHEQEVCGIKWSPDLSQLASGGNDNLCNIWDIRNTTPRFTFSESQAAVKALAWCPWEKNKLATGSGTADRHIRFYNTATGVMQDSIDTKSQVCSLLYSPHSRELLSSHGFSQNQLTIWKVPSLVRVAELTGHISRVLHTALSADGTTVCSAAADETLRFWRVWDGPQKKKAQSTEASIMTGKLGMSKIR
eukprot:g73359.t1